MTDPLYEGAVRTANALERIADATEKAADALAVIAAGVARDKEAKAVAQDAATPAVLAG